MTNLIIKITVWEPFGFHPCWPSSCQSVLRKVWSTASTSPEQLAPTLRNSPVHLLVQECRSVSCFIKYMFSIEVRPAIRPSPKLGTSLLPLLPWFRVSGSESFQLGFWPHYLPALWIQKSSPRIAWALSLTTPGSDGIFCLLELLLLVYLSFYQDSSDCLVCLNLELLPCPSSLVRPVPTAPLAPESWGLFPHLDFTLLISHPNTNGPHLSPFPPLVHIVGPGFPFPVLSCPAADHMSTGTPWYWLSRWNIQFVSLCGWVIHESVSFDWGSL